MKLFLKFILFTILLVMASACSSAFEASGLSADDAAMLSAVLSVDPVASAIDVDYTVDIGVNVEGENIIVKSSGDIINDPANGNSLVSFSGEISGAEDMVGAASLPFNLEVRTLNGTDVYLQGLSQLIDPSMSADEWLFLDSDMATSLAAMSSPELQSSGIMSDGDVDVAAVYSAINTNLFGSFSNYLTASRLDDDGGNAHFVVNLSIGDWLSSDELVAGLETLIPMLAGDTIPADELEANMAQMGFVFAMGGMILEDGTYQFDYWVDPATGTLKRGMITIGIEVDPAQFGEEGDPLIFDFEFDTVFNQFSADSVIVAPETFVDMFGG